MANDKDIDYTAEGATPPREKNDPTNEGYDEAAHSGVSKGPGVFGTSGGGTYDGGMHEEDDTGAEK